MDNQKKAVVVGGSNGIGLAISKELIERGYYLEICDRSGPDEGVLDQNSYHHNYCDLLDFDEELFYSLAADESVDLLMVTAGIGRVADFQYHHTAEIEKMLTVDTVSTLKIFRIFYDRIMKDKTFYTGVMGSISGWMSTPSAAVYAAAKAGVVRFVESVNIELEAYGYNNRILDVSPASFKGSKFYGGKNDLSMIGPLAEQILEHLFSRDTRFIPQYEETFKAVLERYAADPEIIRNPEIETMIPENKFNVVYAGNIGIMQNIDLLLRTAKRMTGEKEIQCHTIGDGVCQGKLVREAKGLQNISFWPMMPLEDAPAIYCRADINIIPLGKNIYRTALPSKTATCIAAQKPIIFAIGRQSHFGRMIEKETGCSLIESDSPEALRDAIMHFKNGGNVRNMGEIFKKKFGRTYNSMAYAAAMEKLVNR